MTVKKILTESTVFAENITQYYILYYYLHYSFFLFVCFSHSKFNHHLLWNFQHTFFQLLFLITILVMLLASVCLCWVAWVVSDSVQFYTTATCQDPLSVGFSRQECWSGLLCALLQGLFLTPEFEPVSYVSCIGRQILYHCSTWEAPAAPLSSASKVCFHFNFETYLF